MVRAFLAVLVAPLARIRAVAFNCMPAASGAAQSLPPATCHTPPDVQSSRHVWAGWAGPAGQTPNICLPSIFLLCSTQNLFFHGISQHRRPFSPSTLLRKIPLTFDFSEDQSSPPTPAVLPKNLAVFRSPALRQWPLTLPSATTDICFGNPFNGLEQNEAEPAALLLLPLNNHPAPRHRPTLTPRTRQQPCLCISTTRSPSSDSLHPSSCVPFA